MHLKVMADTRISAAVYIIEEFEYEKIGRSSIRKMAKTGGYFFLDGQLYSQAAITKGKPDAVRGKYKAVHILLHEYTDGNDPIIYFDKSLPVTEVNITKLVAYRDIKLSSNKIIKWRIPEKEETIEKEQFVASENN